MRIPHLIAGAAISLSLMLLPGHEAAAAPAAGASVVQRSVARIAADLRGPVALRNRLISPGVNTAVGQYSDCRGRTAVPTGYALVDTCVHWATYFIGHSPGVFAPLRGYGRGTILTFFDGAGYRHTYRVVAIRVIARGSIPRPVAGASAQFQTCERPDGSIIRVLDAVAI